MKPDAADKSPAPADLLEPSRPAVISQPGEGVVVRAFGNEICFQLTSEQSGGALNVGLATVPVGARVPPHIQTREAWRIRLKFSASNLGDIGCS